MPPKPLKPKPPKEQPKNNNFLIPPKSFKIFCRTFQTKYNPKLYLQHNIHSVTDYHLGEIMLASPSKTFPRSQQDIYISWLFETSKVFFMFAQDNDMRDDHKFLNLFSNSLYQALVTSDFGDPKKSYANFDIPKKFQIFGKTFDVDDSSQILYSHGAVGLAEYHQNHVSYHESDEVLERAKDDIYHTFWHELVHIIFSSIGEYEKNDNETLVNLFAGCLSQVFVTAKFRD